MEVHRPWSKTRLQSEQNRNRIAAFNRRTRQPKDGCRRAEVGKSTAGPLPFRDRFGE